MFVFYCYVIVVVGWEVLNVWFSLVGGVVLVGKGCLSLEFEGENKVC